MSTFVAAGYGTGASVKTALDKAGAALPVAQLTTPGIAPHLTGYTETAALLAQVGAVLTIPLDGRTLKVVPSAAITSIVVTAPTAPSTGWAIVDFVMGATPYTVVIPPTWLVTDGVAVSVRATANACTSLFLRTDYDGIVHAKFSNEAYPS